MILFCIAKQTNNINSTSVLYILSECFLYITKRQGSKYCRTLILYSNSGQIKDVYQNSDPGALFSRNIPLVTYAHKIRPPVSGLYQKTSCPATSTGVNTLKV